MATPSPAPARTLPAGSEAMICWRRSTGALPSPSAMPSSGDAQLPDVGEAGGAWLRRASASRL